MPRVEVEELIPAPVAKVWALITDVEAYPRFMNSVRSVQILERGSNYWVAAWEIELKGCIMRWVEREEADPDRFRLEYHQVEGDLKQFDGFWQLYPLRDATSRVVSVVQFDLGMPGMSDMLDVVAAEAIRENSRDMLTSLASYSTASVA